MKKVILVLSFFLASLGYAECVNCQNSVVDSIPDHTKQLEEIATHLPCRAQQENSGLGDPFALDLTPTTQSDGDACGCIIGKNIKQIKEQHLEQSQRRQRAFAQMMEARFFAYADNLSQLSHRVELMGGDVTSLAAPGGACNIISQFKKLSCSGSASFQERLANYFPFKATGEQSAACKDFEQKSGENLACLWQVRGRNALGGVASGLKPSSQLCLDDQAAGVIFSAGERTKGSLAAIGEFLNRDGLLGELELDYKLFDDLIKKGVTPRVALSQLGQTNSKYSRVYASFNSFPIIMSMLDNAASFEELKTIFSGDIDQLSKPELFLEKHFGNQGRHIGAVVKNIKKRCDDFGSDLEILLCGEADDPYVLNEAYRQVFLGAAGADEVDSLDEAFLCHARFCKENRVFEGLEGYCLIKKGPRHYQDSVDQAQVDFDSGFETIGRLMAPLQEEAKALQGNLCQFLTCNPQERLQKEICFRRSSEQFNDIEALLAQECPAGVVEEAFEDSPCYGENYRQLKAYLAYQKQLEVTGLVVYEEIADPNGTPDEEGNYPLIKVRHERQSFTDAFWGVPKVETSIPLAASGEKDREVLDPSSTANSSGQQSERHQSTKAIVDTSTGTSSSKGHSSGHRNLEQAERLANAAIAMAENAEKMMEKSVSQRPQLDPHQEPRKLASFAPGATETSIEPEERRPIGQKEVVEQESPSTTKPNQIVKPNRQKVFAGAGGELGDSVIDMGNESSTMAAPAAQAFSNGGTPATEMAPHQVTRKPASSQVLTLDKAELPQLEDQRLKEQGIDTKDPFVIEVIVDGKVIKVAVKPFIFEGKTLYRPELDAVKASDPVLYQAIRQSPIFKDFLEFERTQKAYRWQDVLKILSAGKS